MPYAVKSVKDIPKWLDCPLCGFYNTKHERYLLNHYNKCPDYEGHPDDVESEFLDEDTTIGDYIHQRLNCINTAKKLINTNELEAHKEETYENIKNILKNKLLETISIYNNIETDVIDLYRFFFGKTEESDVDYCAKMHEIILKRRL
jgi:hypothetical protein